MSSATTNGIGRYHGTYLIGIGASLGGTEAIKTVLAGLEPPCPGILIVQHIGKAFTAQFAKSLDAVTSICVSEARHGEPIVPGHAYLAPGDRHLRVLGDTTGFRCCLRDDPPITRHRPSADALFHSLAEVAGRRAVGVILTGMGHDGAVGMKLMRDAGAYTIAQDENSSLVWGMPGSAVGEGGVSQIEPLDQIPTAITDAILNMALPPGLAANGGPQV